MNKKQTSKKVASIASGILRDGRTSSKSKTVAASALSQTWKEFWEDETGRKFGMCSCKDCTSRAEVGAHVQKSDSTDHKWYIVPLCKADNNKASWEHFEVKTADLVPVNE